MKEFEYADEDVSDREIVIAVISIIIGVGILSLPHDLASVTKFADGWIPIVIGGIIVAFLTWLAARLAASFPQQSFLSYTTLITTKKIAVILTFLFSVLWVFIVAFQLRAVADLSREYLFENTPLEIIALVFLLVVIYAVSGPSVGLLRLNMLFLPFILVISFIIVLFNLTWFDSDNLLPIFKTDWKEYSRGIHQSVFAYSGFTVVLFYMSFVKKPKKTAEKAALGIIIPIGLYVMLFFSVMSVFDHKVTENLLYPTIELARITQIPGGFFERFESIFFVIWMMAIFNTTAMALDLAVITMNSLFKNMSKLKTILILAPVAFFLSMFPINLIEVNLFSMYLGSFTHVYGAGVILLLTLIAKIRGVKSN